MRILFVVDYYYPHIGGAETLYKKVAEHLANHHQVTVLTQGTKEQPTKELINNVTIERIQTTSRIAFSWQGFKRAKELTQKADIIQTATYSSALLAYKIKKLTTVPIILLVHEYIGKRWFSLPVPKWKALSYYLYEKRIFMKEFDYYITVSEFTKKQLLQLKINEERITRIYNGVDYELFQPQKAIHGLRKKLRIPENKFVYLYTGRPGILKGIEFLIEAARELEREKFLGVFILTTSPKVEYKKIKNLIRKYRLNIKVIPSVKRRELPSYLAMANTVVVPSLTEGFGFLAAEVSAMRQNLICTNADALPEVVSGKVIQIPPHSSKSIAQAIEKAYRGEFDNILPKKFLWSDTVKAYDRLYHSLTS